jgi:NADP-dependent 3-hydroxy acid dehydrogenase YdfG
LFLRSEIYKFIHGDTYPAINPTKGEHPGRAVLITGASGGIGLVTAHSFDRAGASCIALTSIDPFPKNIETNLQAAAKEANRSPILSIIILNLDVLDQDSISETALTVTKAFRKLDTLVNNAGFMSLPEPIKSSDEATYWKTFEINVRGTYYVTKAFLPLILSSKNGLRTVVNLSSVEADNIRPDSSAYGISKFAILRFTEFLATGNEIVEGDKLKMRTAF